MIHPSILLIVFVVICLFLIGKALPKCLTKKLSKMNSREWVTLLTFLQTAESLPQNEEEMEIVEGDLVIINDFYWEESDLN
jgi:hypothetical protein